MEKEKLADRARDLGAYFHHLFCANLPSKVREVRQIGLMIGIELKEKVTPYLKLLVDEGVLALPAGSTVIRLLPPLVITRAQIDTVVVSLHKVLSS
jgi:acetylornithine/LysW-gamma-L-lysine aminotransferase